ncbi:pilus assembly protein TadG-related protein [Spongiibacter sp.]|uniref:pilus assembly protein TadG-related protein n=1 Tax=Spongiibacter sp. TaxID=2024860 RepID=UPI0035613799
MPDSSIRQPKASARSQSGVIAVMAAVTMTAMVMFLALTVDTGRLFLEKRTLQKQADLAALETALVYCRDQSLNDAGRLSAATDALSSTRNNFQGDGENIIVELGKIQSVDNGNGGTVKQFSVDSSGSAVRVTLSRTINSSLFAQLTPNSNKQLQLRASGTAQACQPIASLHLRSNLLSIDSSRSTLLNTVIGGLLGGSVSLGVAQWDGLLNTDINLLSYLDALAVELGVQAGDYDTVLTTDVSVTDLFDVAATVLEADGNALTVSALRDLALAIPIGTPTLQLGELIEVQADAPTSALNVGLQALQLVQGGVQLANYKSAVSADIAVSALGLTDATIKIQVLDPPKILATGNPELASSAPYSSDAIFVRSSQLRTFVSLDLPIVGATLSSLTSLLTNPLLSGITGTVNSLLALDIVDLLTSLSCLVYCDIEKDLLDIEVLSSPRLDILLDAGNGDGRVTDYDCNNDGSKALSALASNSAADVMAGSLGSDTNDAAVNAFANADPTVTAIPILDLGSQRIRYQCTLLLICWTEYWDGGGWNSDPASAQRDAFTGGGLGLRLDTSLLAASQTLDYLNSPTEAYLPEFGIDPGAEAYQSADTSSLVSGVEGGLLGLDLEFYAPSGDGIGGSPLGGLVALVGALADTLNTTVEGIVSSAVSPILTAIINDLLEALGINLAQSELGATMTCESDKVDLSL